MTTNPKPTHAGVPHDRSSSLGWTHEQPGGFQDTNVEPDDGLRPEFFLLRDEHRRLDLIIGRIGIFPEGAGRALALLEGQLFPEPCRGHGRFGH